MSEFKSNLTVRELLDMDMSSKFDSKLSSVGMVPLA